jgi:formylglycine-generating enzyme required for sulfatase activity
MPSRKKPPPKAKTGRAYYYRMRTPEKRLETYVKLAAAMAIVVVVGLIVAFGSAFFSGPSRQPEQVSAAAPPPAEGAKPKAEASDSGSTDSVRDCASCPPMVIVPAGSFVMGTHVDEASGEDEPLSIIATESPAHGVTVQNRFALQQTEVTRGQFAAFVKDTGYQAAGCKVFDGTSWVINRGKSWRDPGFYQDDDHPVVCVSPMDARAYIKWMSDKAGIQFRLPSESEWEYAARAGNTGAYIWGSDRTAACVHANAADAALMSQFKGRDISLFFACDGRYAFTAPVGKHKVNAFGLGDMLGNVREITADCWNADYRGAPTDGAPRTDGDCGSAASRGGGWLDPPANMRTARRLKTEATERRSDQGFRVARDIDPRIP